MNFEDAISNSGLGRPHIVHDGKIHRFTAPDDRPGSNNCWCVSHGSYGAFGSWKLGITKTWHDKSDRSKENDAALAKQIRKAQRLRKDEIRRSQKRTKERARDLWASGSETIIHQYPESKQIVPYGVRQKDTRLLVPMYYDGQLCNIQQIDLHGNKRFLKGGRVSGCYMPIGRLSGHIYICEGYSTGCSLHEHTGAAVVIAFNAGNLKAVAKAMRLKYPDIKITIAADNDTGTKGNPGLTKGREAAAAVGGDLIYPDFSDLEKQGTDFNDYLNCGGMM